MHDQRTAAAANAAGPAEWTVARSLDELASLEPRWRALRTRMGPRSAWSTPERFLSETAVSPTLRPFLAILRCGDADRAMILGRTSTRPMRCGVGPVKWHTPSLSRLDLVHGGLLVDDDPAALDQVAAYVNGLLRDRTADVIGLNHEPVDSPIRARLAAGPCVQSAPEPHWTLRLESTFDATFQHLSGKHRSQLRRHDRILVDHFGGDVQLRILGAPDELPELIEGTSAIAEQTYQAGIGCAFADTPVWRAILGEEARGGSLRAYWLIGGGKPIAFMLGAIHDRIFLLDYTGYTPEFSRLSPGRVLLMRVFADLCQSGCACYDYGFGDAEYKRLYGTEAVQESSLTLFGSGWRARAAGAMLRGSAGLHSAASGAMERSSLLRKGREWLRQRRRAGS